MSLSAVDTAAAGGRASNSTSAGEARNDARQRVIVDDAIAVLGSTNTRAAFEYLRAHGVGMQIIERVLLEPLRRRAAA